MYCTFQNMENMILIIPLMNGVDLNKYLVVINFALFILVFVIENKKLKST